MRLKESDPLTALAGAICVGAVAWGSLMVIMYFEMRSYLATLIH